MNIFVHSGVHHDDLRYTLDSLQYVKQKNQYNKQPNNNKYSLLL